jgi:hypothetical protein
MRNKTIFNLVDPKLRLMAIFEMTSAFRLKPILGDMFWHYNRVNCMMLVISLIKSIQ